MHFKVESGKTNVSLTVASVAGKQGSFRLTDVKVAQKKGKQTFHPKLAKREQKTWHDASTKEAAADDTGKSNTNITSRVSQPQRTRRRLTIRHAAWILTRYNVRRSVGVTIVQTLVHCSFLKIAMEQHSLTHFPSQSWMTKTQRRCWRCGPETQILVDAQQ